MAALQSSRVQTYITQIITNNLSRQLNATVHVGKVDIRFFNRVSLEDVLIEDQQKDTLLYTNQLTAHIGTIGFQKRVLALDEISLQENRINIIRDSTGVFNYGFLLKSDTTPTNSSRNWTISCTRFAADKLNVYCTDHSNATAQTIRLFNLRTELTHLQHRKDTTQLTIKYLSFDDKKFLELKNLTGHIFVNKNGLQLEKLKLQTRLSEIEAPLLSWSFADSNDSLPQNPEFDITFDNSQISLFEMGALVPALKGMTQNIRLSGRIYGSLKDLKGKEIRLLTGTNTHALLNFYINDLQNPERMYLFVDLKDFTTSFNDLSSIHLPYRSSLPYLKFPQSFYESGLLQYKGNFSGFLTDFVTYGTLTSKMGSLSTDLSVRPSNDGSISYRGKIATFNFKLGKLFQEDRLNELTFTGSVDGTYDANKEIVSGKFNGQVRRFDFYGYRYQNIFIDGSLDNRKFDGELIINDPNLNCSFLGLVNFNDSIPNFNFQLRLDHAQPGHLHWSKNYPESMISLAVKANFEGDRIDNLDGDITVSDGRYLNKNGEVRFNSIALHTIRTGDIRTLSLNSPFTDLSISGQYNFRSFWSELKQMAQHYLPAVSFSKTEATTLNNFDFKLEVKDPNPFLKVLVPGLEFQSAFSVEGNINSTNQSIRFMGNIPGVKYKNFWARNLWFNNKNMDSKFHSILRISELSASDKYKLYNFALNTDIENNQIDNTINWSNYSELTYSGTLRTHTELVAHPPSQYPIVRVHGLPSRVYLADSLWSISPFTATITPDSLHITPFAIINARQQISISGASSRRSAGEIRLNIQQFDLGKLPEYIQEPLRISGTLDGNLRINNVFNKPTLLTDLSIHSLAYRQREIGDILLTSQWNDSTSTIDSRLTIKEQNRPTLEAEGSFFTDKGQFDYQAVADSLPLIVLESVLGENFSNLSGYASGKLHVGGTVEHLSLNGKIKADNAGLTIIATQVPYTFTDTVYFEGDTIRFNQITINDPENNTGIFDGTIVHHNFSNMQYNMSISTDQLMALNTTVNDNERFYGRAYASGILNITGKGTGVILAGSFKSLKGTDIKISMYDQGEIEQYDFIEFIKAETEANEEFFSAPPQQKEGYKLSFTIQATPEAKVQLIYNSQIGDIIKAQGEGILLFEMDAKGNMSLSGDFTPTKGDYLFTLQNVINKRFTIAPGGSIVWSGDPYNAIINISAIYKLRASLYDLIGNTTTSLDPNQRLQVACIIKLSGELLRPDIDFEIDFPGEDKSIKDLLSQYFNTEEELSKQILSLIVMGKFYTPEYQRGIFNAQGSNPFGSTATEMLSNQLSNWLSQINDSWDFGINYRPGNQISDDEIEIALSTQIFNDRVTLNGNIGNNTNMYGTSTNSSQIVGDFEMSVKLVPSGKIQFKAYSRSNNNLIYETAPYTQGIGFSFKEEFNTFDELLQKLKNLFQFKKQTNQNKKKTKINKNKFRN